MRSLSIILFSLALIACSFLDVSAQKKPDTFLRPLPENATLEETQAWLVRAISENGSYLAKVNQTVKDPGKAASNESGYADSKVAEVKFQGSVLTYKIERTLQLTSSNSQNNSPLSSVPTRERVKVTLDLKDINPEEVTLQDIDAESKIQAISMRTYNYKRAISLKGSTDTGDVSVSVANIVVGKNIAEQVQAALIHAVKLCQPEKP